MDSVAEKIINFLSDFSGVSAYGAVFGMLMACGFGFPLPEDVTLLAAGLLAGLGKISLIGALFVGMVGVLLGDAFVFFLGRHLGKRAYTLPIVRTFMTESRIKIAEEKVMGNEKFICFIARFLPGLRSPIFLTAGIMGVKPMAFFALDGFAALISVPVWVVAGWYFASNLDEALNFAKDAHLYIITGVVVVTIGYVFFKIRKKKNLKKSADS